MTSARDLGAVELGRPAVLLEGPALVLVDWLLEAGMKARYGTERPLRPEAVAVVHAIRRQAEAVRAELPPGVLPLDGAPEATEVALVGIERAAKVLSLNPRTVRRRAEELGGRQVDGNGSWVFDLAELEAIAANGAA